MMNSSIYHYLKIRGDAGNIAETAIDAAESGDVDLVTVYTDVYEMRIQLEKMRKPVGSRDSPARSCKDLHHGHPQLKDGNTHIVSLLCSTNAY